MILIWTGKGFLVPLTTIGVVGLFGALVTFTIGDAAFEGHPWLWGVAFLLAAAATWILGRRINKRPALRLMDLDSGRIFRWKARNSFCFVSMEYWAAPMAAVGVALLVRGLVI